jgi:predicted membrane protein
MVMSRLRRYIHILRGVMVGVAIAMAVLPLAVSLLVFATTSNATQSFIDGIATFFCLGIVFSIAYILEGVAQQQAMK